MWIRIAALAVLISTPLASRADPTTWSPDDAIESSTTTLTGPLVEGGVLLARSCLGCKSQTLRLTAQTRLFIGAREVTLAELNKFLEAGGKHGLGIGYDRTERTVTRLVVFVNSRRPSNSRY